MSGDAPDEATIEELSEPVIMPSPAFVLRARRVAVRIFTALTGVAVFIYGIQLMKESARILAPLLESFLGHISQNPTSALGFGWLSSYAVMSGSPIAAFALGLMDTPSDSGTLLSPVSTYFMIMGSRLGASFIVIVIGLVAMARGGGKEESLSIGVLSFLITYSVYIPAIILGYFILTSGSLSFLTFDSPPWLLAGVDTIFGPPVRLTISSLPPGLSFFVALGSLYIGLSIFDKAFHRSEEEEIKSSGGHRLLMVPAFSFLIGAGITFLSTSVSLSVGMLVPLYLKGYVRRRDIIPFIMGANVTTFIDTLVAAIVLNNRIATNIVLIQMVAVLIISIFVLIFYKYYLRGLMKLLTSLFTYKRAMLGFALTLVVVPIILLVM